MVKYFAYGSNMNNSDLDQWCRNNGKAPIDLSRWQRAWLQDFDLDFTRYSDKRKGGVADIVVSPGNVMEGVLLEISEDELEIIAEKEGERHKAYCRTCVKVKLENGEEIEAVTFQVCNPQPLIAPHQDYLNIIIAGAKSHGLSERWIQKLKRIPTQNA